MKWSKGLFFGGLAAGAYFLLKGFSDAILCDFAGLRWMGVNGLKLKFALLYKLTNTNDIPTTVSSLKGQILYGDYKLNDLVVEKPVTVAPGQSEELEVQFSVSPGILLAEILRFVEQRGGFSKFRLKGWLSGKIGDVPYKFPLNETLQLAE